MSTGRSDRPRSVVIGVGNPLMGDDGLGLVALQRLSERWELPADVELVDGGTWGLALLPVVEDATNLLLIDAIDVGAAPGTPVEIPRGDLPRYFATKLSPHQIDLRDVFALAELRGTLPRETRAIGVQPARLELSDALTEVVGARVDEVVERAVEWLGRWGHACTRSSRPAPGPPGA